MSNANELVSLHLFAAYLLASPDAPGVRVFGLWLATFVVPNSVVNHDGDVLPRVLDEVFVLETCGARRLTLVN